MARIVRVLKTLRNNWKKTVFGTVALVYGVKSALRSYECTQMMRAYCEAAKEFGEAPISVDTRPRQVTVILNPAANKRKAKKEFEEYCAPLLHLAGLSVNLLITVKEGQARTFTEKLEEATDAIIIAGGDGTISEAVTGLLRREDGNNIVRKIPLGVLPLGKTNSVAKHLFSDSADDRVKLLAEATMAVIQEATKPVDAIKFQIMPTEQYDAGKPVYGLVGMQWGAFRDAFAKREKYWYYGGLRGYASYFFTGMKDEKSGVSWQVQAKIEYSPPCEGCSNCYNQRIDLHPEQVPSKTWWSVFGKRQAGSTKHLIDYREKVNEECGKSKVLDIMTTDFSLLSSNVSKEPSKVPQLLVTYGPEQISFGDFLKEGYQRENGEAPFRNNVIHAKEVKLWPKADYTSSKGVDASSETNLDSNQLEAERWISIDNEDYEVKAIHATLLPNVVKLFCSPSAPIN